MSLDILVIGGSGEISSSCVAELVRLGHRVSTFNRGTRKSQSWVAGQAVREIVGDVHDSASYSSLGGTQYDVVCQFLAFTPADIERDIEIFGGCCAQYIFISSASCYQKPWLRGLITEETPLNNPYLSYSQNKAACETVLAKAHAAGRLNVTVVRPSHTYRERLPSTVIDGLHLAWRIQAGKPVIVHDDGESLWTLTRAEDFARAFALLCANSLSLGETYHITSDDYSSWNRILQTIGEVSGHEVTIVPVSCEVLNRHESSWAGPLWGDKANNIVFDNSKISAVTDGWRCEFSLRDGLRKAWLAAQAQLAGGYVPDDSAQDALIDTIVREAS